MNRSRLIVSEKTTLCDNYTCDAFFATFIRKYRAVVLGACFLSHFFREIEHAFNKSWIWKCWQKMWYTLMLCLLFNRFDLLHLFYGCLTSCWWKNCFEETHTQTLLSDIQHVQYAMVSRCRKHGKFSAFAPFFSVFILQ